MTDSIIQCNEVYNVHLIYNVCKNFILVTDCLHNFCYLVFKFCRLVLALLFIRRVKLSENNRSTRIVNSSCGENKLNACFCKFISIYLCFAIIKFLV